MKTPKINFQLTNNQFCCGVLEIGSFDFKQEGWGKPAAKFTREEVLADFEEQLKDSLVEYLEGARKPEKGETYLLQTTVVTDASNKETFSLQFAFLAEHLKSKKWIKQSEFINPNTGNTVEVLYKKMPVARLWHQANPDGESVW